VFVYRWLKPTWFILQSIVLTTRYQSVITGEELIDEISSAYGTCGMEGTVIVVNSNKQANRYNQGSVIGSSSGRRDKSGRYSYGCKE